MNYLFFIIMCKQVFVLQSVEWFFENSLSKNKLICVKILMAFHFKIFHLFFYTAIWRSSVILTHSNWEQNVQTEVKVIFRIYFWTWEISVFVMDNVHNVHKMSIFFFHGFLELFIHRTVKWNCYIYHQFTLIYNRRFGQLKIARTFISVTNYKYRTLILLSPPFVQK